MLYKLLRIIIISLIIPCKVWSQILPKEDRVLNYRLIGFSYPAVTSKTGKYKLEIASGTYNNESSFNKNVIKTLVTEKNKIIAEVPFFNAQYTWRVIAADSKTNTQTAFHHFSTGIIPDVDSTLTRFRVTNPARKHKDAYVFLDGNKALYDMSGNPVWYVPEIEGSAKNHAEMRDIKASSHGTITMLINEHPYEINYNGVVLWKGPANGIVSGDTMEHFHHEFTRLSNGHYMVLGIEFVQWNDYQHNLRSTPGIAHDNGNNDAPKTPFGTIIEYDENDKVVWSWKSSSYFMKSDLKYYSDSFKRPTLDIHDNAFFFNEKEKVIYISYKNISRILKIKYPEGTVLSSYGEVFKPGVPPAGNGLFCAQHACKASQIGCLFLFNNNGCNRGVSPMVKKFQEPVSQLDNLKKIWEYECTIDNDYPKISPSGGNVIELPDHSLFVSMGGPFSKIFIVRPDKTIGWSALPERWSPDENKWKVSTQYRGSIITDRKELERLIWNAEQ